MFDAKPTLLESLLIGLGMGTIGIGVAEAECVAHPELDIPFEGSTRAYSSPGVRV